MNIRFVIYKEIAKPIYELDRRMQQKSDFDISLTTPGKCKHILPIDTDNL